MKEVYSNTALADTAVDSEELDKFVEHKDGGLYRLNGDGWSRNRFEFLQKTAREKEPFKNSTVAVLGYEGDVTSFPILELHWIGVVC